MVHFFKLKRGIKQVLEKKGYNLTCSKCGDALHEGECVVSRSKSSRAPRTPEHVAYYHKTCWESGFV